MGSEFVDISGLIDAELKAPVPRTTRKGKIWRPAQKCLFVATRFAHALLLEQADLASLTL
jgi:hypothetical protein